MFNKLFIVPKLNDSDNQSVSRICNEIHDIVKSMKQFPTLQILSPEDKNHIDNKTLIIAIGGDGTMLEAMRLAHKHGGIATGVNLGKVGFLTDFPNDSSLASELRTIIRDGGYPIEERIALQYHMVDKGNSLDSLLPCRPAFNEFVISNKLSDHLIKYTLFIGDRCAGVHRANALIIGTPTGSTAYSLSAGGGLLLPSMEAMQIIPVAPISMTSRPIIIPSHEDVRISIETHDNWILKSDGSTLGSFENNLFIDTQVVITQSKRKVNILHSKHWSYFDMLTQKLGWKSN